MRYVQDWSVYNPFFTQPEFRCKHTGVCKMEIDFMDKLLLLRKAVSFPFIISSGYRAAAHPVEAKKEKPGEHYYGRAADIKCFGEQAYLIAKHAPFFGFTRLGFQQGGPATARYIHLGTSTAEQGFVSPTIWSY